MEYSILIGAFIGGIFSSHLKVILKSIVDFIKSFLIVNIIVDQSTNAILFNSISKQLENRYSGSTYIMNNDHVIPLSFLCIHRKLGIFLDTSLINSKRSIKIVMLFNFRVHQRLKIVEKMFMKCSKDKNLKIYRRAPSLLSCRWLVCKNIFQRTPTLFFPQKLETDIFNIISTFFKSKRQYESNGRIYCKTILFTGDPGGGKSSMIRYLSLKYNKSIYVLNLEQIASSGRRIITINKPALIVIEDIDSQFDHHTDSRHKIDMSNVLNFFDGLMTPENVIIILTCNVLDKIPAAMFRKGRIDDTFVFPKITEEVFGKINKHFKLDMKYSTNYGDISLAEFMHSYAYK